MTAFIMLFVGLLLIFLEFYTPGGILAVIGAIFLIASVLLFLHTTTSLMAGGAFIVGAALLLAFVIWFALYRIRKSSKENTFYLSDDQEGYQSSHFDSSLIGKQGKTLTDLGPSGFILIDGRRLQAVCRGPYLDRGSDVIVIGGEGAHLIVKPISTL